ncbi:hypothetical protein L3Q82_007137 [Scortum barcoo]|uniref:Uncharacterized protein n=1 Tax=Scortum barcoo TaxID=214431 RepID=A0ACB8WSQ6_9TELE|nr:hypothetical protein L3Q82_007137 [Scortum barcoo]
MVLLGCKSPKLKHVVCHRRQLYMILKDADSHLNLTLNFKVDGFNYIVFVISETMKCFGCGAEGHLIPSLPRGQEGKRPGLLGSQEAGGDAGSSGFGRPVEDAGAWPGATRVTLPRLWRRGPGRTLASAQREVGGGLAPLGGCGGLAPRAWKAGGGRLALGSS